MAFDDTRTHPIDLHVGVRVRMRRRLLGMTQGELGRKLGLAFQQIQKYERGTNRISASKLFEIARVLKTSITYFYDEYPGEEEAQMSPSPRSAVMHGGLLTTAEGIEMAEAFPRIRKAGNRRKILDLVRLLADGG